MAKAKAKTELFQPKHSKKLQEFICDKIEEGTTLAAVCEKYAGEVPNEKTMYRWMKKYPDFKKAINEAYKTLLMCLIDKKLRLAERAQELAEVINQTNNEYNELTDSYDRAIDEAIKKAKFEIESIKVQQKALEFTLTRIAPKFVEDLRESASHNAIASLPPITIINYADKRPAVTIEGNAQRPLIHDQAPNK